MFKHLLIRRNFQARLSLGLALVGCLVWLALASFRSPGPDAGDPIRAGSTMGEQTSNVKDVSPAKMEGAAALAYLEETEQGQSLMQAVMTAQYGLKWQQKAPGGKHTSDGYLAMSHDQNLNAWFDKDGICP